MTLDAEEESWIISRSEDLMILANRGIGYLNGHGGPSGEALRDIAEVYDRVLRLNGELCAALRRHVHFTPNPERPNLGLGHTADCPHFERYPWACDCQVRAANSQTKE